MNDTQKSTLKAAILADTALAAIYATGAIGELADALNATASPDYIVWRPEYTPDQKALSIDVGITQLDALTSSKRDSLLWWVGRTHDARLATTQAAISDLCGSQSVLKNALLDGAKIKATVAEKIFSTGTGTTASPATSTFSGTIGWSELINL